MRIREFSEIIYRSWSIRFLEYYQSVGFIKPKKFTKKKPKPANEISEDDVNAFMRGIKNANNYSKVNDLQKMFPSLNILKINTIIRYLERSKRLVIDSDGYIIWIREENSDQLSLADVANITEDFVEHLNKRGINFKEED